MFIHASLLSHLLQFLCTEMNTFFTLKKAVFDDQATRLLLFICDAEYRLRTRRWWVTVSLFYTYTYLYQIKHKQ